MTPSMATIRLPISSFFPGVVTLPVSVTTVLSDCAHVVEDRVAGVGRHRPRDGAGEVVSLDSSRRQVEGEAEKGGRDREGNSDFHGTDPKARRGLSLSSCWGNRGATTMGGFPGVPPAWTRRGVATTGRLSRFRLQSTATAASCTADIAAMQVGIRSDMAT